MPGCFWWRIDSITGSKEASVLPEPVGATTRRFKPVRISAIAATCIGLRCAIRALSSNSFFTPSVGVRGLPWDRTCWNEVAPYKLHLRDAEWQEDVKRNQGYASAGHSPPPVNR